mgnify:CR=1 FL=1
MSNLMQVFNQSYYSTTEKIQSNLSDAAITVLREKNYLRGESPDEMFTRVARAIVAPLITKLPVDDVEKIETVFYNIMASCDFLPNSPTLINAGRSFNQLAACFVVPVEDSMEGIFRGAMADMAMIQRTGGGTGFDFSSLRPSGATVTSTMGESSGPISFLRAFDGSSGTIKQGGARRGANMGTLRVDHPNIRGFITLKSNPDEMQNFNLSVAITDEFMSAVESGTKYDLIHAGVVYGQEDARAIWNLLAERAWAWGEPGVIFIDTINKHNTLPGLGPIAATNPCGEQPLLPYEACNLGSINLRNCVKDDGTFDYNKLRALTCIATVFLDCVIDAGTYPLPQITEMVKNNRKIGLGIMGFADVCYMLEVGYDTAVARHLAKELIKNIQRNAEQTSEFLGNLLGSFPNITKSAFTGARRNATLTTIAPTGTLAVIAGVSYGIEPFFGLSYKKVLSDSGTVIDFVNPHIEGFMERNEFPEALQELVRAHILKQGTIKNVSKNLNVSTGRYAAILHRMETVFVTAQDIAPSNHVRLQAAFQQYIDNAVSKTINFDNDVSVKDIQDVFLLAYSLGCKGLTVYRDGCRTSQPLTVTKEEAVKPVENREAEKPVRKRPPQLTGVTRQIPTGCGMMLVTVNMDEDGNVFEVLMRAGASGGCSAYTDAVARLLSIALRHGVALDILIDQLRSVRCDNFRFQAGKDPTLKGKSCPDTVGRFLQDIVDGSVDTKRNVGSPVIDEIISAGQINDILQHAMINTTGAPGETCPECGKILLRVEGCMSCQCGYSKC